MSRLSFRPRPLDIHKKLPILKSIKDFEDDDTPSATRTQMLRLVAEADNEAQVPQAASKKTASEIPTPEYVIVDTYERDYSATFNQPTSYLRARGARAEIGEFIEYDLDNEDEDWLEEYNKEGKILPAEKVETIIFKLEVLDHKAREKAGVITPTLGAPVPVLLTFDAAVEALQALSIQYGVFQSIYNYWKEKRQRWQKPVLRRLQPPPPATDTNPYNVFRPREKAHRLHTRRMQRRENSVQSFEKLRQVRRNLEQAKNLLEAVIRREEKKRDVIDIEVILQRTQMKYKNETELLEDSLAVPGLPSYMSKFAPSEDEFFDSDDIQKHSLLGPHAYAAQKQAIMDSRYVLPSGGGIKREFRRQPVQSSWLHKLLYYLNQVTNKRPEELIYDTKESITSLVKSNEEIMIESQNKEEATTSNRKNLRTTSEIKKFVTKKYREVFNHLVDTKNAMDDVATIPVLKEKIYEMDNKEDEIYEMDKKVEEYDEDTTRVGPFKVRTTQAPTVDDRKLLELCFGKVEEDTVMVGVKDHEAFNVNKNMFCNGLKPEGWISNVFINCVADMLCIRECIKGDVQRWFFPMHTREYRILSQKRSRKQKRSQNQPEYCITKQQLQSVKQIFFPTYKDNHFYLIVFNTMEHRVEVWDTMKETENLDKYIEEIAHLCHFLDNDIGDGMLNEFKGYTGPIVIDVLQQDNTSDCGVFVCRSMEFPDEVMKLNKWITEEERCNMALRMLKASENVFSVEEAASNKLSKLNYAGKKGKKPRRKE